MKMLYKLHLIVGLATVVIMGNVACTNQTKSNPGAQVKSSSPSPNLLPQSSMTIPFRQVSGANYVPVNQIISALQYQSDWNPDTKTLRIGDSDVNYVLHADSPSATKEDSDIQLSSVPKMIDGQLFLPVSAVAELFQQDMHFETNVNGLVLYSREDASNDLNAPDVAPDLNFGEDNSDSSSAKSLSSPNSSTIQALTTNPSLKNIDIDAMIRTANQYIGVPYEFGTASYPQSKRFDCASFTQYVYGQYGVNLVRPARAQAKQGVLVSRNNLRKGDLLFFYVPGRFKTNNIVGHNGIYIGGGKMINAVIVPGKNGVQITDINKPYWKRVFMFAKRVAY